jgi:LmbE family N-acetylglucosaminyl deacetylase
VTVFAGVPARDGLLSPWDVSCGAGSSRELMRRRRLEDHRAMGITHARSRHLPFLDQRYREEHTDTRQLAEALRRELADATEVWIPAAICGNPDHVTVRTVAFSLLAAVPKAAVWLYAEYPHHQYLARGQRATEDVDGTVAVLTDWFSQGMRPARGGLPATPQLRTLAAKMLASKRAAVRCYESQLELLNATMDGRLLDDKLLRAEYAWCVRSAPTTVGAARAGAGHGAGRAAGRALAAERGAGRSAGQATAAGRSGPASPR